jgi:arylsulfatase A-like enzyme
VPEWGTAVVMGREHRMSASRRPNIVLIALDTQRADHLGCYGYHRDTSPNLDAVAAQGVVFERCYAPNIPTHPSFTTLYSGKEAVTHDIVNIGGGVPIKDGVRLLPEILADHGYATAAVDNMERHFSRGFEQYHTYQWDRSDPTVLRKAETVTELALPVIDGLVGQDRPFFCFLHYWDPHTPYLPPPGYEDLYVDDGRDPYDPDNHSMDEAWSWEPFKWYFHDWMPGITDAEYVINLYDGEVRYMDHHLARVFEALGPVRDDTIVVITADHGEILNEQLGYFDHHGLYEPNVHIPLIMSWPGTLPAGRRVPGMVQNLDVAQTLLDLTGIQQSYGMEGLSLLPPIYGVRDRNYTEVFLSEATWQVKRAVRTDRWKFIRSIEPDPHGRPERELFDLEADPLEKTNLAEQRPETVTELEARLDAWIARRLAETGRESDPVADQGACATNIGQPKPDERVGPGAVPLHQRGAGTAAGIPDPSELNAQ